MSLSTFNVKLAEMGLSPLTDTCPATEAKLLVAAVRTTGLQLESVAAACLATLVYRSGAPTSKRKEALDKLIRTGLHSEAALDAVLAHALSGAVRTTAIPELDALAARYPNGFNTRQLIKLLGVDATYLLAMSSCSEEIGRALLAGHCLHGGWFQWIAELQANAWHIAGDFTQAVEKIVPLYEAAVQHPAHSDVMNVLGMHQPSIPATATTQAIEATQESTHTMPTTAQAIASHASAGSNTVAGSLRSIQPALRHAIEAMLQNSGAPGVTLDGLAQALDTGDANVKALAELREASLKETETLMAQLRIAKQAQPLAVTMPASISGVVPSGKMVMVDAASLFPEMKGLSLQVPSWQWDSPHPDVPKKIDGYIFRRSLLLRALRAIARGENIWLQGHTGSGKTTFAEQIACVLGWPVLRIALDSAIDRAELVGRMNLKSDGKGGTVSEWLPGALERAIPNAYILLLDEIDAGHPNSLYTLQPVLEGKGLTLLEDGGRIVPFHPLSRIIATGNTAGAGDESGLYPACRILSAATLDRFPEFIEVPYLTTDEEADLIHTSVGVKKQVSKKLAKFASEMREAFVKGELPVSYSPRRSVSFARAVEDYMALLPAGATLEAACDLALAGKLMQATPNEHRARLTEIARTCLGTTGAVGPL